MTIVFYISGHGFGHATRNFEVINHILAREPGTRIVVRSTVPRWFIERSVRGRIEIENCDTDTGVIQIDSLGLDEAATASAAAAFYARFAERVDEEARVLRALEASIVVADMPPLAFAASARAGVASIGFGNFTWDWIYEHYTRFDADAPGVLQMIRSAYETASLALRLPFHGGFAPMRGVVVDVPLVARRSRRDRDDTRRTLGLDSSRPIVLASFGGHGASLNYDAILRSTDVTLVVTDYELAEGTSSGRLRCFLTRDLAARQIAYEDLVHAADVVVSKPGYGIVSECIANGASLLYTSRGHFVENDVLIEGMHQVLRCGFIDQDELRAGRWQAPIDRLLAQAGPPARMDVDGARVAAAAIVSAGCNTTGS